eukprot:SAG31_NODE_1504_length_8079_cov_2.892607_1_plen_54_part_00
MYLGAFVAYVASATVLLQCQRLGLSTNTNCCGINIANNNVSCVVASVGSQEIL